MSRRLRGKRSGVISMAIMMIIYLFLPGISVFALNGDSFHPNEEISGSGEIWGTVSESGSSISIADVRVDLHLICCIEAGQWVVEKTITQDSDESGYYEFNDIPSGNYVLEFEKSGYFKADTYTDGYDTTDNIFKSGLIELGEAGELEVNVYLDYIAYGSISGTLINWDNVTPVADVKITVANEHEENIVYSDHSGKFFLENVVAGENQITFSHDDCRGEDLAFEVLENQVNSLVVKMQRFYSKDYQTSYNHNTSLYEASVDFLEVGLAIDFFSGNDISGKLAVTRSKMALAPISEPENKNPAHIFVKIEHDGELTNAEIDLSINYDLSELPENIIEEDLKLYRHNEGTGQWELLPHQELNTVNRYIKVNLSNFSYFGVFAQPKSEPSPDPDPDPTPDPDPADPTPVNYGHVLGNETITVSDAIAVLRHIVGLNSLSLQEKERADLKGNGVIDVTVAIMILRKIVGLIDYSDFPVNQ